MLLAMLICSGVVFMSFKAFIYIFSDKNTCSGSRRGFLEGSLASPLAPPPASMFRSSGRCVPTAISHRGQGAEISVISVCLGRLRGFM